MNSATTFARATLVAAFVLGSLPSSAASQDQTAVQASRPVVEETFDSDDSDLVLGGQLDLTAQTPPWFVHVSDGKLVMENRLEPQSLHYNDISWVTYPETDLLASTENAVISATVEAKNSGKGGAGILLGSGKAGSYLMFSVDGQGQYHVLRKDGRSLRPMRSAKHVAIHIGAPNELSFELRGANVVFLANGTEVIRIPYEPQPGSMGRGNDQSGVGLAAFGIGKFSFDNVEIARPD